LTGSRLEISKALGVVNTGGLDQLADCPDTPNCQGSQSSDPKQQVKTFNFTGQENPIAFIEAALSKEPGVRTVILDDHYLHVTFSTKIFNFTDDVEFYQPAGSNDVQVA